MKTLHRACLTLYSIAALLSGLAATAKADTFLSADLQSSTSVAAQSGFTRWGAIASSTMSVSKADFSNENGGAVTATITSTTNFGSRDRGTSYFSSSFPYSPLYNDLILGLGSNSILTLAFTGLTANTSYYFTFYSLDPTISSGTSSTTTVAWTSDSGSTVATLGTTPVYTAGDALNYDASTLLSVAATGGVATTNSSGSITFYISSNNTYSTSVNQAVLNGFSISTIPEPATAAAFLGVLAAMGAVLVRRRRSA